MQTCEEIVVLTTIPYLALGIKHSHLEGKNKLLVTVQWEQMIFWTD